MPLVRRLCFLDSVCPELRKDGRAGGVGGSQCRGRRWRRPDPQMPTSQHGRLWPLTKDGRGPGARASPGHCLSAHELGGAASAQRELTTGQ